MTRALVVLLVGALLVPAYAIDPGEALGDPVLEARARALSVEFRCLSKPVVDDMTHRWHVTCAPWYAPPSGR